MPPELAAFQERLSLPERSGVANPYFVPHDGALGATTRIRGTELVDFSGYDYLGLRQLGDEPERVVRLRDNARLFRRLAVWAGLDVGAGSAPVVPVITGGSEAALLPSDRMRGRGVNVQPILYPAVEESAARLRFFINATHTRAQISSTVEALAQEHGRR